MIWTGSNPTETAQIAFFSALDMPKPSYGRRSQNLRTCLYNSESQSRTGVSAGPVGLNSRHESLLIQQLVEWYGWHAAEDGNLYSPMPSDFSWGDDAA